MKIFKLEENVICEFSKTILLALKHDPELFEKFKEIIEKSK